MYTNIIQQYKQRLYYYVFIAVANGTESIWTFPDMHVHVQINLSRLTLAWFELLEVFECEWTFGRELEARGLVKRTLKHRS